MESSPLIRSCVSFQVKAALDIVSERLSAFTDVGNSCSHVEHILKDLASFEEKSRVRTLQVSLISSIGMCGGERYLVTEYILSAEFKLTARRNQCLTYCAEGIWNKFFSHWSSPALRHPSIKSRVTSYKAGVISSWQNCVKCQHSQGLHLVIGGRFHYYQAHLFP